MTRTIQKLFGLTGKTALVTGGSRGLGLVLARRLLGGRWGPAYAAGAILLGTAVPYYATLMPSDRPARLPSTLAVVRL